MYWNTYDTSGNPSSALRRSSCILPNSELGKWFHLLSALSQLSSRTIEDRLREEGSEKGGGVRGYEIKKGHSTYVLESPYSRAGALTNCFPPLHRLHLNVSWVSHSVSLNSNNCLKSSWVKWRAVSSASSTTHADRFCFWHLGISSLILVDEQQRGGRTHCLWKIFSSIVPVVWNLYTKPDDQPDLMMGGMVRTFLLLTISPYSSQGLLITSRIPILPISQNHTNRIDVQDQRGSIDSLRLNWYHIHQLLNWVGRQTPFPLGRWIGIRFSNVCWRSSFRLVSHNRIWLSAWHLLAFSSRLLLGTT